ncbi:hypothetical protein BS47DRAFT_1351365, partial [Hydnum rufescens UP504]
MRAGRPAYDSHPERTGVVIMGAGEGIGQMLSLKFAGAGYTVFACLPHDVQTPRGTSSSSGASHLLARNQRDGPRWVGTIVPLMFDASTAEGCEQAVDTIAAYCERHNIRLRSMVVPPITPSAHVESGSISPAESTISGMRWTAKRRIVPSVPFLQTTQSALHDAMSCSIFQPLAVIQALSELLSHSQGQVLFLSGCNESSFRPSQGIIALCDAARETSPLQKKAESAVALDRDPYSMRRCLAMLSLLWAIDDETCFTLVQHVIESRYPRTSYSFGIDVLAERLSSIIPHSVWDLAQP